MKRAKSFGVRGMSANERAAANPYLDRKVPLGGEAAATRGNRSGSAPTDNKGTYDEGLRAFMLQVYNLVFAGLCLTGLTAWSVHALTATTDPARAAMWGGEIARINGTEYLTDLGVLLWGTPLSYVVCFGPLLLCVFCAPVFRGLDAAAAAFVFALVAMLIGVSFSALALVYANGSITMVFFVTAAAFGGLSLLGYTTRADLTGWGSFLWMGLVGLLAAIVLNWWLDSDALDFVICSVGVIVFAGFTAYDTQQIKEAYSEGLSPREVNVLALSGALDLFLDFVNLFRFLLYFLGEEE